MPARDPKTGRFVSKAQDMRPIGKPRPTVTIKLGKVPAPSAMGADPFALGGGAGLVESQVAFASEQGSRGQEVLGLGSGPITTSLVNMTVARRRSRHAVLTNPYAKRAVDVIVSNVVGSGHRLISEAPDPEFKKQVEDLWEEWQSEASSDPGLDYSGVEAMAFRSMLEGGDSFVRMRTRRDEDGMTVPLKLQVFESEQVPVHKNESTGAQPIVGGIQFDALGQPIFYHMHQNHPDRDWETLAI